MPAANCHQWLTPKLVRQSWWLRLFWHGHYGVSNRQGRRVSPWGHQKTGLMDSIQVSVHYLHVNRYADYRRWTPLQPIPKDGLLIPPAPQLLFTCLEVTKRLG